MAMIQESIHNGLGTIALNRPDKLNCLNLEMVQTFLTVLEAWESDERIQRVVLKGQGKAFCAGGDVVALVEAWKRGEREAANFFAEEYKLDHKLATYPKPLLVLGHGAVMGGGWGLFQGGACRVLDPKALLAMPEVTIGLFPDVGATYFLNRLPKFWGLLIALTGMRLSAGVAVLLGLAEGLVEQKDWERLEDEWAQSGQVSSLFLEPTQQDREFIEQVELAASSLFPWPGLKAFDQWARTPKEFAPLEQSLKTYRAGSPTSAAVIERQLLRGQDLTLEEAYRQEVVMAKRFLEHHDFFEGVRALLIDKDKQPQWQPDRLELVSKELVKAHFF